MEYKFDETNTGVSNLSEHELAQLRQRVAELETLEAKHRETEESLAHERNLLRTLVDHLLEFVYFKDTQSRFVVANSAVAHLMKAATPEELIGKTDFDFYPADLAARYFAAEQQVITSGQPLVNHEEPVFHQQTDQPRWISSNKIPLRDSQGQIVGVVGLGRDITEWKRAEEALQQSKQRIENILESITDAFFAVDKRWRFTYVNQRAEQLLHKTRAELLHKSLWAEFPGVVHSKFNAQFRRAMTKQVTVEFEEYYEPLETWFKVHAYPYSDGLSVYFRDVTERKQAEAILAQRAAQLALINDIGSKIAAVLDLDTLLNRAARLVHETFNYHHVALFLLDQDRVRLKAIAGSYQTFFPPNHTQLISQGIIGWVVSNGQKIVANDVTQESRYISLIPDRTETQAELCVPIKVAGQTVGVIDLQSPRLNAFGENDIIAMEILTDQVAVAIENARLYQALQQELAERKQAEKDLQQSKTQLLNVLEHLDELVHERTAELSTANVQLQQEIIERRRVEHALRESESNYRLLMEQASDGIFIADYQGNLLEVNSKGCEMLDYTHTELLRLNLLSDLIPAEDLAARPIRMKELLAGKTILAERRFRCRNGTILPVEISAKMLDDGRLQAIVRDITERKQAQESLQRYAERVKTLQELDRAILAAQSPEAIAQVALHHIQQLIPFQQAAVVGFDFESYEAVMLAAYVSGQARVMVGVHPPLDMFGIAEELRQGSSTTSDNILSFVQPPLALQALGVEGNCCYINVPLVAKGKLIGGLSLGADTADAFTPEGVDIAREVADPLAVAIQQARLHEQIQRYAAELEQRVAERTAKLEEINDELNSFSFSVSHDLRAPLRAVHGFADALLEDYTAVLDEEGQKYAQRIVDAAHRMDILIQDLLVYSRLSRSDLRLQPVDLDAVVTDVLTQLEITLQEQRARLKVEKPLPRVIGHYATVVQIVSNLVSNAVKFVPAGVQPSIRIWAEIIKTSPGETREAAVRLWVEDNGIGIEPEYQERIFQIFERLHGIEAYPGTGVGLAIVRKGAARLGGRAGVESHPGHGSRFWIELPQAVG
ncbi:MAG: PAS domain-containing protein [Anaerolineae bacterium]|nr:PAS domain-containing protein [Anaerolineae bacterium]